MVTPDGLPVNVQVRTVLPTIWRRLAAEWWLASKARLGDSVLCFGNLPPVFRLSARAVVFVQNRYLIDQVSLSHFSAKTRLRLAAERIWFRLKAGNAGAYMVQTPSMKRVLECSGWVHGKPVYVVPFVDDFQGYSRDLPPCSQEWRPQDFIYVASGEPHKNHRVLVEAWSQLARAGYFPTLWLTLDQEQNHDLCLWIRQQSDRAGLKIENLGGRTHEEIRRLYTQSKALIYPSTFESFGLPLVEARQSGLAVLASEMDFVRDVLDPEQSFDPHSPVSIARAVKRFMGWSEEALPLRNAADFLQTIMNSCE